MYFNLACVNFIRCPRAFRQMLKSADLLEPGLPLTKITNDYFEEFYGGWTQLNVHLKLSKEKNARTSREKFP